MSERDDIVTRLRTDDASDDLLISAASLLETDADEIERLRAEVALWHQLWDNVALDVPDLRADNKPLAVAASYELLKREVARLTAEQDAVSVAIGTNEYMDPPDGGNVSLAEQVRRMRAALLARAEAWERASQEGHPAPCTLGPLCPYCEIDRLRARAEAAEKAIERVLPAKAREHIDCWKVNYGLDRYDKVTAARRWAEAGGPSDGPIMALATAIEWLEST